jgi:hypothetical protein
MSLITKLSLEAGDEAKADEAVAATAADATEKNLINSRLNIAAPFV